NTGAGRADHQMPVSVDAQTDYFPLAIVGSGFRPNQRALRPFQFFDAITICSQIGHTIQIGDRADAVTLWQLPLRREHARQAQFFRRLPGVGREWAAGRPHYPSPFLALSDRENNAPAQLRDLSPMLGGLSLDEQAGIGSRQQMPT